MGSSGFGLALDGLLTLLWIESCRQLRFRFGLTWTHLLAYAGCWKKRSKIRFSLNCMPRVHWRRPGRNVLQPELRIGWGINSLPAQRAQKHKWWCCVRRSCLRIKSCNAVHSAEKCIFEADNGWHLLCERRRLRRSPAVLAADRNAAWWMSLIQARITSP